MIHIISPYSTDKNLGKAYNDTMKNIPDGDWVCLTDYDVLFLTSDCGVILNEYAKRYPDTGIFTCLTNRIHPLAKDQLFDDVSENTDILFHVERAEIAKSGLYKVHEVNHPISGFLMMINKNTWNKIKFVENAKCLGVDNFFSDAVLKSGLSIRVMLGLYVWHTYRIKNIRDKSHLL